VHVTNGAVQVASRRGRRAVILRPGQTGSVSSKPGAEVEVRRREGKGKSSTGTKAKSEATKQAPKIRDDESGRNGQNGKIERSKNGTDTAIAKNRGNTGETVKKKSAKAKTAPKIAKGGRKGRRGAKAGKRAKVSKSLKRKRRLARAIGSRPANFAKLTKGFAGNITRPVKNNKANRGKGKSAGNGEGGKRKKRAGVVFKEISALGGALRGKSKASRKGGPRPGVRFRATVAANRKSGGKASVGGAGKAKVASVAGVVLRGPEPNGKAAGSKRKAARPKGGKRKVARRKGGKGKK
jgi:hypothetical protein